MISGEYHALSQHERGAARFRARLLGRTALCGALSLGIATGIAPRAKAGPEGTVVVGGAVDVAKAGTHTEFTQHTQTAILNHDSFDIRVDESVNFAQPNARALAVNRVVGSDLPTSIAGKLTANGNVWVLNPSGVAIQGSAQVNVGGLTATTASISDEAIAAGQHSFSGAPGGSAVTNAGSITAGDGSVVLVAPVVSNSGTITTNGSDIALGAGSGFTVDFDGDGLTRFEVTPGKGVSLSNTGAITAQGGAAYLSAASSEAVKTAVVSIGGKVEATRIEERGGVIVISGGDHGVTEVSGRVDASQGTGRGGRIIVTGELVDVQGTAAIDASGENGGGTVEIGGAFQGGAIASDVVARVGAPETAPLPTGKRTVVRKGARIAADAGSQGDGGEVIVWADEATGFRGEISARGGAAGGDGGFAEVSGRQNLLFDGSVDLGAPQGASGTLLLDPANVSIVAGAAGSGANDAELDDTPPAAENAILAGEGGAGTFTISAGALQDSVNTANTVVEATNAITQSAAVDLTGLTANSLTYRTTSGDITFDASFTGNAGAFVVQAGGSIRLNANLTSAGAVTLTADADASGAGTLDFSGGGALDAGALSLTTGEAVTLGQIAGTSLVLNADGTVGQSGALSITGTSSITATDAVTLSNAANDFGGAVSVSTTGAGGPAAVTLRDANNITLGAVTASSLSVTGAEIDTTAAVNVSGGTVTLVNSQVERADIGGAESASATAFVISQTDLGRIVADQLVVQNIGGEMRLNGANASAFGRLTLDAGGGAVEVRDGTTSVTGLTVRNASAYAHQSASADLVASADVAVSVTGEAALRDITATGLAVTAADVETSNNAVINIDGGAGIITLTNGAGDAVQVGGAASGAAGTFDLTDADIARMRFGTMVVDSNGGDTTLSTLDTTNDTDSSKNFRFLTDDIAVVGTGFQIGAGRLELVDANGGGIVLGGLADLDPAAGFDLTTVELALIHAGTLAFESGDAAIALNGASVGGALELLAGTGTITASGASQAGSLLAAGSAFAMAGGSGLDLGTGGATVSVTGSAGFEGIEAASLSIDASSVAFAGINSVTGLTSIDSSGSVNFGAATLETQDLTVGTSASVVQAAGGKLGVSGSASLSSAGSVDLLGTANDFATASLTLDVDGNAQLAAATGTAFAASTIEGDLTVAANGNVTQTGSLTVGGSTAITATGGNVTLQNTDNDFADEGNAAGDRVDISAGAIAIHDRDTIRLGTVAGSGLSVTATDVQIATSLDVGTGIASFTSLATGEVFLGAAGGATDFDLADADFAAVTNGTVAVDSAGAAVTIASLAFGGGALSVDAGTSAVGFTDGPSTLGGLTVSASSGISQQAGATVGVSGATDLTSTGAIALGEANDFANVNASGTAITLGDVDDISLGTVTGTSLAVTATDVDVVTGVSVSGQASFTHATGGSIALGGSGAAGFELSDAELEDIDSATLAILTAGDVALNGITKLQAAALEIGVGGDVAVAGTNTVAGTVTIDAGANPISIASSGTAGATDIDFLAGSSLAAGTLTYRTTGTITLNNGADLSSSLTELDGNGLTVNGVNSASDLVLDAGTGLLDFQGNTSVSGLSVTSSGSITQSSGSLTAGTADFVSSGNITLALATDFTTASFQGVNVTLVDVNGIALDDVSIAGNLTVVAGGSIVDTDTGIISVSGSTSLAAQSGGAFFDVLLDGDGTAASRPHSFAGLGGGFSAVAQDLTVHEVDGINLGAVTLHAGGSVDATIPEATGRLTVRTGGNLTQSGTLTVPGRAVLLSDQDITLALANDFGGPVDASAGTTALTDAGGIVLGDIQANALTVTAGGAIVDTDTGSISVAGTTSLSARSGGNFFDILLDGDGTVTSRPHRFAAAGAGSFIAEAQDLAVHEADGMDLGAVTLHAGGAVDPTIAAATGQLAASSGGDLTQSGVLIVPGRAALTSAGNVAFGLDNLFGGAVDAAANEITLADADSILLGRIDAGSALTVEARNGGIGDDGAGILVGGTTSLSATGDVVLDDIINDFNDSGNDQDQVDVAGANVSLADANDIVLGQVRANGTLSVTAASGIITDRTGSSVSVSGRASLGADTLIDLSTEKHDFAVADLSAQTVTVSETNDIVLGRVAADTFTLAAGGAITDSGAAGDVISVTGTTSLLASDGLQAFDILLDGADGDPADRPHDFGGAVAASGADIAIVDTNALELGNVTAAAGVGLLAGGDITQATGTAVKAPGASVVRTTSGAIVLTQAGNDLADEANPGGATVSFSAPGDVTVVDFDSIALGASSGSNLHVTSTDVSAAGDLVFGGTVRLTNGAGDGMVFGGAADDGSVANYDVTDAEVARIRTAEVLLDTAAGTIDVQGATLDAESLTIDSGTGSTRFSAATTTVAGVLTVTSGGTISQDAQGAIEVAGKTSLTANGAIQLAAAANDFDSDAVAPDAVDEIDASGTAIALRDRNAVALGQVAAASLTVDAGGSITDTAGKAVSVTGATSMTALTGADAFDILLDNVATHDFSETQGFSARGEDIAIVDIDGILLGTIETGDAALGTADLTIDDGNDGDLAVTAGGDIAQNGVVTVRGEADLLTPGNVNLDRGNDFQQAVNANATSVLLTDANAIRLGTILAGDLTVRANGTILDTAGRLISVTGDTALTASDGAGAFHDIRLDSQGHQFASAGGALSATGEDLSVIDIDAINFGRVSLNADAAADPAIAGSSGSLTALASGDITQTGVIAAAGETDLDTLGNIILGLLNDFGGAVDANAVQITLADMNALQLGEIRAGGNLVASARGPITDTDGRSIRVAGSTSLAAVNGPGTNFFDIVLDNANTGAGDVHDLGSQVDAVGEDILLTNIDALALGAIAPHADAFADTTIDNGNNGDLIVRAGGQISQTVALTIPGELDLTALDFFSATRFDALLGLDNAFGGAISADLRNLTVRNAGGTTTLGAIATHGGGNLTVTSTGGAIADTAGEAVVVTGTTSLVASNGAADFDIRLDNADTHDFQGVVRAKGRDVALDDTGAIALGAIEASRDLAVNAGGTVTDAGGEAIVVNGRTTVSASNLAGTDFFDIAFGNAGIHDFNVIALEGEDIVVRDLADLVIASATAHRDGAADPTIAGAGRIDLAVASGDFGFVGPDATPLEADGNILLSAPAGSFGFGARRRLQDGLTFTSRSGNIALDFANGFVVEDRPGTGPFTLNAPNGTSSIAFGNAGQTEALLIGSADFLSQARSPGFNPLFVTADIGDDLLFQVTGGFALTAKTPVTVRVQNTSRISNDGRGTLVDGRTILNGNFAAISLFGTFNGAGKTIASIQGFQSGGGFVPSNNNTVNGCVILLPSSCQPIGTLALSLNFPDGGLLGIKFLDPDEDEDDPFTNRGDEEEWE